MTDTVLELRPDLRRLLARHRFDPKAFALDRARVRANRGAPSAEVARERLDSVRADTIAPAPAVGTPRHRTLRRLGAQALRRGEVALLVLAGGMATRFGAGAKAVSDALPGRSFLDLRLRELRASLRALGARAPVVLMTSFATHDAIWSHVREHAHFGFAEHELIACRQSVSLRLTPDGELFRDEHGEPSLYAPGHGELASVLADTAVSADLYARGIKSLIVFNIDNMGFGLDAGLLGNHLESRRALTVEVVEREAGDSGGGLAFFDGGARLMEGFRLPRDLSPGAIELLNTNTLYLSWQALDPALSLPRHPVWKQVDGRRALQFESILGELTHLVRTHYVRVSRDPLEGRFLPVKTQFDLEAVESILRIRYREVLGQRRAATCSVRATTGTGRVRRRARRGDRVMGYQRRGSVSQTTPLLLRAPSWAGGQGRRPADAVAVVSA